MVMVGLKTFGMNANNLHQWLSVCTSLGPDPLAAFFRFLQHHGNEPKPAACG